MPTNQEWLHKLANESPDELKAWFDAEHNDNLAAEKVVSDEAVNVTTEKRTITEHDGVAAEHKTDNTCNKSVENVTDSRVQLETLMLEKLELQRKVDELTDSYEASSRALEILTLDKAKLATQVDKLQSYVDDATADYAKLVKERDNLAADLLTCNREREQLRKHLGIALDHAHDMLALVDIDGNVLDVGN